MNSQRLRRLHRRHQLVDLVQTGRATLDEAAHVLGISKRKAMSELAVAQRLEDQSHKTLISRMRQIHHERLETLQARYWDAAESGDDKSARILLKAMDQQARLLGINAPEQKEVTHGGSVDLGLEALTAEQRQVLRARIESIASDEVHPSDEVLSSEATTLQLPSGDVDTD